jgi:Uncharacterised protein family UPF0547
LLGVLTCHGGAACDTASTISSLIMAGFLLLIVGGLIVSFFSWIGSKTRPGGSGTQSIRSSAGTRSWQEVWAPSSVHLVPFDQVTSQYRCNQPGCQFTTPDDLAAAIHEREATSSDHKTASEAKAETSGFEPAREASAPTQAAPAERSEVVTSAQYKSCPDCAEDVRFAARKCRFCGYLFEQVPADQTL